MKGIQGLMIAIVLGVVGAVVNYLYLRSRGQIDEPRDFVVVTRPVKEGQRITPKHIGRVTIPQKHAGKLARYAFRWNQRDEVIGFKSVRPYDGGELVFRDDLREPPGELLLQEENEVGFAVPIDPNRFVAAHVTPRKTPISFIVPKKGRPNETELLGPFEVLAVGNRYGSPAAGRKQSGVTQQHIITVRATIVAGNQLDEKSRRLQELLGAVRKTRLAVVVHPKKSADRKTAKKD